MTEYLNFEPNEFKIIEEFDFDETIERPEAIRFYTLDEQVNDAYEKFVPRTGRISSYQLEEIKKEVDKIKDLYEKFIVPEADTYSLKDPTYGVNIPWIFPVYASNELQTYDFEKEWLPLFDSNTTGFYPRMLASLPKPYLANNATPFPISKITRFLSEEGKDPIMGLPNYEMTRRKIHETRKVEIMSQAIEGTADLIGFKGYYALERPVEVPNPTPDHEFFKDNKAVFIEKTAPLRDIIPSIDAIITHGVPANTRDPYNVGMKYLKVYDVTLADIPWQAWKTRFPPVEESPVYHQPKELPYPKVTEFSPPDELLKEYKTKYYPGLSQRNWLMSQIDAGNLVAKMLLSLTGKVGIVNQSAEILATGKPPLEDVDPQMCQLQNISFNEFTLRGIFRDKKCVPLDFILEERKQIGYKNRLGWKDSTANDILIEYLKALEGFKVYNIHEKHAHETKVPIIEDSDERKEVVAILQDTRRFNDDKIRDLRELLRDTAVTNHVYNDKTHNRFVLCEHTLEQLAGSIDKDRKKFLEYWTALESGFRVCKFCGERVVEEDFVEQQDYTEDGFKVVRTSAIETKQAGPHDELQLFTTGLKGLAPLFNLKNPEDDTLFLIISILQILPEAGQVKPILDKLHMITSGIKPGVKGEVKTKGAMALGAACILIQSHIPILISRRSFGTLPLYLDGYPRDESTPGKKLIVDSILLAISRTFGDFPTALKGPSVEFIRAVLKDREDIKKLSLLTIKKLLEPPFDKDGLLKNKLVEARAHRANTPVVVDEVKELIPTIAPPEKAERITGYEKCHSGRPYWTTQNPPLYRQARAFVTIRVGMTDVPLLEPSLSERNVPSNVEDSEIRKNLAIKLSKDIKLKIGDDWRINIRLATHLASIFRESFPELDTLDVSQGDGKLRDITKGYLHKILKGIEGNVEKLRTFQAHLDATDVGMYIMTTDVETARKNTLTLRAKERTTFTERMRLKSDIDREITKELLKIGNVGKSAYIIVNKNREEFAQELEDSLEDDNNKEELVQKEEEDTGVGEPRHLNEQGAVGMPENTDNGDYGDYEAEALNEGKDYEQEYMADENDPI